MSPGQSTHDEHAPAASSSSSVPAIEFPPVGTRITGHKRTITETDIVMFASLTGDWHPLHCDAEWARGHHFGERVAHGLLVLSFSVGLANIQSECVVALRRLRDVVFKRPARIGDTIRVEAVVSSVRPLQEQTALVALRWDVLNALDQTLVRAILELLWQAGPQRSDAERIDGAERDACTMPRSSATSTGVYPF
jgi:3-hydroxybutyryl-CoA dehydratase